MRLFGVFSFFDSMMVFSHRGFTFHPSFFRSSRLGAVSIQQNICLRKKMAAFMCYKGISEKLFVIPKLDAARVHNSRTTFLIGKMYKTRLNNGEIFAFRIDQTLFTCSVNRAPHYRLSFFFFFHLIKSCVYIPNTAEVTCCARQSKIFSKIM